MGCGIHLFTERKRTINNVEKWVCIDHFKLNPYYGEGEESQFEFVNIYGDRNYKLFATLADVRNYDNNPVISAPRHLPDDCSDIIKKESDSWGSDGHSHSYLTLKELKDFREENKITKYSGMMTPENAQLVDAGEMPNSWCKSTNQQHYVYREWTYESDVLKTLIEAIEKRKREEFWIYNDEERPDLDDSIRIVFWFDN